MLSQGLYGNSLKLHIQIVENACLLKQHNMKLLENVPLLTQGTMVLKRYGENPAITIRSGKSGEVKSE